MTVNTGKKHDLFEFLPVGARKHLVSIGNKIHYKKDHTLFLHGDDGDSIYLVTEGTVSINTNSAQGKEAVFSKLAVGDIFGEIAMLDGGKRTADAHVLAGTTLIAINRRQFFDFLQNNPALYEGIVKVLCRRIRWLSSQIESFVFTRGPERLVEKLVSLADRENVKQNVSIRISQSELGKMLGMSREMVNKNLRSLENQGLLKLGRSTITIFDMDRIKRPQSNSEA